MSRNYGQTGKRVLSKYLEFLSPSNAKRLSMKLFLEVTFVPLIRRASTVFLNFLENAANFAILVCCATAI